MGILDGLMGNASEINLEDAQKEFAKLMAPNETVEKAFVLVRDMIVFTNRRLIVVDRQGITGKKTEYHSILYNKITQFSIETAGTMDMDSELRIWVGGNPQPIQKQLGRKVDVYELQAVLATHC